jgi:hypothetical protein
MGVYKSADGAATWRPANQGLTWKQVRALVVNPRDGNILYAGTDGGGVFRTVDGGGNLAGD